MIISHIAALSSNRVIGKDNDLPWHLPEDLKYFKEKTNNHIIVMGRKTFESLPKTLPNRHHVVITRQKNYQAPGGVVVVPSIGEALKYCKTKFTDWPEEVFILGGGEIFEQTLKQADRLYLTEIQKEFDGDAFYPEFSNEFILAEKEDRFEPYPYSFCLYVKNKI